MNKSLLRTSIVFALTTALSVHSQTLMLERLTTFGTNGDGTIRPGDYPFLTVGTNGIGVASAPYNRGLAYNATTDHLLVVNRAAGSSVEGIYVLNASDGSYITNLPLPSFVEGGNGSFRMNLIGVAEDGAIYVGNLSNSQNPPQYRLYRWADENSSPNALPVFPPIPVIDNNGDPSNGTVTDNSQRRWGDTMAVRGSGTNTQVLIANRGTLVAILRPTDETMTTFYSTPIPCPVVAEGVGWGLTFGPGNSFLGTGGPNTGGPLYWLGFTLSPAGTSNLHTFDVTKFNTTISPIAMNSDGTLLAGITSISGADTVQLYDISDPVAGPVLRDRKFFATGNHASQVGALAFAGNRLFALGGDNGIMAFQIAPGISPVAPVLYASPSSRTVQAGNAVTFAVGVESTDPLLYQWFYNTSNLIAGATNASLVISNVQMSNAGQYHAVVSNDLGTVTSASATLVVSEIPLETAFWLDTFSYNAGTALVGQGGWVTNAAGNALGLIEAGNLEVTGLRSALGNRASFNNSLTSARRPFASSYNSGILYYSLAMRVDNPAGLSTTASTTIAGFAQGTSTTFGAKLDIRATSATTYQLGVSKAGSGAQMFDSTSFTTNDIVFIVARYTFDALATDTADMWINPDPATFGLASNPPPTLTVTGGTDNSSIDRFFFRISGNVAQKMVFDEVRVGLTWADVTPVFIAPQVPPTLSIVRNNSSVTVSWPASYTEFILEGTPSLSSFDWSSIQYSSDGTNNVAVVDAATGHQFLRLRK